MLDYLVHSCYTESARAFLRDTGVMHVDADGDEVMGSPVKESSDGLDELEEMLAMDELRKGALVSPAPTCRVHLVLLRRPQPYSMREDR